MKLCRFSGARRVMRSGGASDDFEDVEEDLVRVEGAIVNVCDVEVIEELVLSVGAIVVVCFTSGKLVLKILIFATDNGHVR